MRLPVAAKIALQGGANGGSPGSPTPLDASIPLGTIRNG
jgi:hypothetical protein